MTMFADPMPSIPKEFAEVAASDPGAVAAALGQGMEAFKGAMAENGGDMGAALEAMGDVMGPLMGDLGISLEVFDAVVDAVGAAVGSGMHMAPVDAGGAGMGAIIQDAITMMMPEGMEMPESVMEALGDIGQGFADTGCNPHDMAAEMMPPPGEPGFPLPCDANGECIVPPGNPGACPEDACQPPPMNGACAEMGGPMMPPDGGYDHASMPQDAQMPPPMEAMDPPVTEGPGPDGAYEGGPEGGYEGGPGPEGMAPGPGGPEGSLDGAPPPEDVLPPQAEGDPMGAALDDSAEASDAGAAGGEPPGEDPGGEDLGGEDPGTGGDSDDDPADDGGGLA